MLCFTKDRHLSKTEDDLIVVTLERKAGPAATDPSYQLGHEWSTPFARFPAGLVLYWVTTNLWTVGQGLITRRLMPKTPPPDLFKRSSRTPPKDDAGGGNGDKPAPSEQPKTAASRPSGQPRRVRRKKGTARRR